MKLQLRMLMVFTLVAVAANAGDFLDTRIAFALANSNVFVKPGQTTPSEPGFGFQASSQNTQFYDNFNTRFSGFENLTTASLYKKGALFFEGWEGEAALNFLLTDLSSGRIELFDNSSYVKLNFRPQGWGPKEDISFTGFPVSSDRFRLGFAWRVSWAGDPAFTYNQGSGTIGAGQTLRASAVPGFKLQVTREHWYAFVGAKAGLLLNNLLSVQERQYGVLAGAGVDLIANRVRFEANGGFFTRGIAPSLAIQGISAPINAAGISAQLAVFSDTIQPSLDMRLYKNDPDATQKFFKLEQYPGGLTYQLSLEASALGQTLIDPDKFAATKIQSALAIALQARFKYNYWRFYVLGIVRSPSFIQFDVPGFPPYVDFSRATIVRPEVWGAIGLDRHLPSVHATIGMVVGLQNPANFTTPRVDGGGGSNPPATFSGTRTVVIRDRNLAALLPQGDSVTPIFSIKANAKFDLSDIFAIIGEVFYNRDDNRISFRDSTSSISQPVFEVPNQLGFNAVVQARF
jgi:hypothetical protein